ncbi:hypothetical protein BKA62DRAFT_489653 [Auriculariales sp. MPI-PUGE-AT-0066]|nr:hypothetical protein BKA62DRAFT_489653 [Auriculariales sp. MPI-PUGE-AT-0066]
MVWAVNGANGQPIKIPCSCPPSRDVFIDALRKNVQAGHAVNNPNIGVQFPVDDSIGAQITRITAALITIQNLNGPGSGCPAASTTLVAQQTALREGNAAPAAPAPAPPAPTPDVASPPANSGGDDVARLAPDLGFEAGRNPNGTGDCDGALVGANGQPVKVPCSCPPPRDVYIDALRKNVQAGHAVNNPSISVSFPLDDSKASQSARITAALISLQNLNGPGVGCPAASTTLLAQQKAL